MMNIEKNGLMSTARRIFNGLRYKCWRVVDDTWFDWRHGVNTSQVEKSYLDGIDSANSSDFQFYEAVKSRHFRRMVASLPIESPSDFDFVDIGCGKGRGLILAGIAGFRSVHGIEISSQLADCARKNVQTFCQKNNRSASFRVSNCSAEDYTVPKGNLVVFLYNPFVGRTMRAFIDRLSDASEIADREIFIIYRNPVCHDLISANRFVDTLYADNVFATYRVTRNAMQKSDADDAWDSAIRSMERLQVANRIRNIFRRRRFHALALGTSKTGSHSIRGMFSQNYRSAHEPNNVQLIKAIIEHRSGSLNDRELRNFFKLSDQQKFLEMESNSFNFHFINILVEQFPAAKVILLFRDPGSWLNSWINHQINRPERKDSLWEQGLKAQYRVDDYSYGSEEELFLKYELFPLEAYLAYWARCNQAVLDAVPSDRLLLIKTEQLSGSGGRIADFLGIEPSTLNMSDAHLFKSAKNHSLVSKLDSVGLENSISSRCGPTLLELDAALRKQIG